MLAGIQPRQSYRRGPGGKWNYLKPGGSMRKPAANRIGCCRLVQFIGDSFGDKYFAIKRWQNVSLANEDQVPEWRRIGDYNARHGSEAKPPMSLAIIFQILPSIVQPDLMLL
jgi:hypothetical protein